MYLPNLNLCPTMRCNLKCKLCGVLVPHYEYRPHATVNDFSKTLKAVFEIVDSVGKLQITGGEPLLHKDLPQMIEQCFEYSEKFETLLLFTNCTIPFNAELINVLEKYKAKVLVYCSDYGVKEDISADITKTLEENKIPYKYIKYYGENQYFDGWIDNGDFVAHNRTAKANEEVFKNCSHVKRGGSWYVRNGQMHWCGRSARGCELGKIPLVACDYLDIESGSIEEKREKLNKLLEAKSITACDYCNGFYGTEDKSKRYFAGEQL